MNKFKKKAEKKGKNWREHTKKPDSYRMQKKTKQPKRRKKKSSQCISNDAKWADNHGQKQDKSTQNDRVLDRSEQREAEAERKKSARRTATMMKNNHINDDFQLKQPPRNENNNEFRCARLCEFEYTKLSHYQEHCYYNAPIIILLSSKPQDGAAQRTKSI